MSFFYPGGLWAKRLVRIAILFTVGLNVFLNRLQDRLFDVGQDIMIVAETVSSPAGETAMMLEKNLLPFFTYIESTVLGRQMISKFGLPESQALQGQLGDVVKTQKAFHQYGLYFSCIASFLHLMNWIFFISTGLALLWLLIDLYSNKNPYARYVVLFSIFFSIPLNIIVFQYLNRLFPLIEPIDFL